MNRYVESIKNALSSNDMKYKSVYIHPEEYGNEKINEVIKTSNEDIINLDSKIKDLASKTNDLLERTTSRLNIVMDTIIAEKERLQDITMLCNSKTDYDNAIILKDNDFEGKFNFEDGVFFCQTITSSDVKATVEEVTGNGYEGNKHVRSSKGYLKDTLATDDKVAIIDGNVSTYWEYSRVTAASTEPYLISDFNTDDAEASCTVTLKMQKEVNEVLFKSSLETVKVIGIRYSNDGVKYTDLAIPPFTINKKDEGYESQGYVYGSNLISFPKSKYLKVTFQSIGYTNEILSFERSVVNETSDTVEQITTVVSSAKRHVVRINDIIAKSKTYTGSSSYLKSRELIDTDTEIYAISVFANVYLPDNISEECVEFSMTVNGLEYKIQPVNSHTDGIKIIRFSQGKMPNKYTEYIGEKIQSAKLNINIKPQSGLTPYINNLKILLGGEI